MDKKLEARLTLEGWEVECEHPLELRHEDGSFASGQAARLVIEYLQESNEFSPISTHKKLKLLQSELCEINELVQRLIQRCIEGSKNLSEGDDSLWEAAFGLIFSENIHSRVTSIEADLSISFQWNDLDAGYADDVQSYAQGLQEFVDKVSTLLD